MKKLFLFYTITISLILIALLLLGVSSLSEPDNTQMSDLSIDLSEEKILNHLKQIAQKPHPIGSLQNEKVRKYIFTYLIYFIIYFILYDQR